MELAFAVIFTEKTDRFITNFLINRIYWRI